MKQLLKKMISKKTVVRYHEFLAEFFARWYGNPSERMQVIGVTGTNGKSSVVSFISQLLSTLGKTTGYTTTAEFKLGNHIWLNDKKMTMLGRGALQKMLKNMATQQTEYVIIETSSEGVAQERHKGIQYDVAVFTNLTPEHIESHGNFENYKKAKQRFFKYTASLPRKEIKGKKILKQAVINADDAFSIDFVFDTFDVRTGFSMIGTTLSKMDTTISVYEHATSHEGSSFTIDTVAFNTKLFGETTIQNILTAMATLISLGFTLDELVQPVKRLLPVPGRFEFVDEGQPFTVVIDYAPEPASLKALYTTIDLLPYRRLIHVLGSTGGGRDKSRRPILGAMSGKKADIVIITNEDPYDEDPHTIISEIANGARGVGKKDNFNLFEILDRKEAIAKALKVAMPGDLVIITGKGCEQAMVLKKGKMIPWDDRVIVKELLLKVVDKV